MLLKFGVKNYKSFVEELNFNMTPASKQKDLNYSILKKNINSKSYKGLCSAVIYGPNASGKSNLIGAMDTFKAIVLRGNIRNLKSSNSYNVAADVLELIPNNKNEAGMPVAFSIKFIEQDLVVEYSLKINIGAFLESNSDREIEEEALSINEKPVFVRKKDQLELSSLNKIKGYINKGYEENVSSAEALAKNNLNSEELFLMNGFKAIVSSKLVQVIVNWLEEKFTIIYRGDSLYASRRLPDTNTPTAYVEETINEACKLFGISSNALGYLNADDESEAKLCSLFEKDGRHTALAAEIFESYGTIRFVNLFPLVIRVLLQGGTLVIDEFDASIHPMALINIINIFHNDDINKNHAQLIFNTHNPVFLNPNVFRRDEIKFLERDEDGGSIHYALSDFGTAGENGVRKNEDYMKNYFISRYGAIRDIDFTPVFENLLKKKDGNHDGRKGKKEAD